MQSIEPEAESARLKLAQLARDMMNGKLSFIEGARLIWRLGPKARLPDSDPDLTKFLAVDTQTDSLPVGKVRDLWAPEALERLEPELRRAEEWARQFSGTSCQSLLSRFGSLLE